MLFAEPALLAAHRASLERIGSGPRVAPRALAGYLEAERAAGRLDAGADPVTMARLLLGACLMSAFLSAFEDRPVDASPSPAAMVRTVLAGSA